MLELLAPVCQSHGNLLPKSAGTGEPRDMVRLEEAHAVSLPRLLLGY